MQGKPGVQEEPIERSQLETILAMSALALNNTPYLSEENTQLMAPVDLYAPWHNATIDVRALPDSNLKDLEIKRRALMVRKEKLWILQKSDLIDALRYQNKKMSLGHGKRSLIQGLEDVVLVNLTKLAALQLGVKTW